ncbi:MAG: hypothetical protein JWP66_472 [Naasia sp.]|nr:hypothetical protein [Naasia sp.]
MSNVTELARLDAATFIDVREEDEYRLGNIPTARNLPSAGSPPASARSLPRTTSSSSAHPALEAGGRHTGRSGPPRGRCRRGASAWLAAGLPTASR